MDAAGAAWIGVIGAVIGGFVGSLATWLLGRRTARRDQLVATYGEWGVACQDVLARATDLGVAISGEMRSDPGLDYPSAALFYLNKEPGNIYWREYVEFVRLLQVAQFKVATLGDGYDEYSYPRAVLKITGAALRIKPRFGPPDVKKIADTLRTFSVVAVPMRFSSRGWSSAFRVMTLFRKWLLADVVEAIAESKKSDSR
jgi:hypothetical protein